jgi:hypothetical protein
MATLETRIFIGSDKDDATAQLSAAIEDGSFPVLMLQGCPVMWITHRPTPPNAMATTSYELHVTAWVKVDAVEGVQVDALANEQR